MSLPTLSFRPRFPVGGWLVWGGFAAVLAIAPVLWTSSFAQTML